MPLPTPFYLRTNQNTPLTYGQLDGNFTILNTKIDNTTLSNVGVGIGIFKNKDVNANSGTMNVYSLSGTNGVNISISDETILIAGGGTFTGNTSGSCITDLHITNLYGCSPITVHDNIQHMGSTTSGLLSVAFGNNNVVSGDYSFSVGEDNVSSGNTSFSIGGENISGNLGSFAGGYRTKVYGRYSYGLSNVCQITQDFSSIFGGATNNIRETITSTPPVSSQDNNIFGGVSNLIDTGIKDTIVGGQANTIRYNSTYSGASVLNIIAGGNSNIIDGHANSAIIGGSENMIDFSVISNNGIFIGTENTISGGGFDVIIGGSGNTINGVPLTTADYGNTVVGGVNNTILTGNSSTIIGGKNNTLQSSTPSSNITNSVILGGENLLGSEDNTVYVPNLNINSVGSNAAIYNLGIDSSGNVVSGSTDTFVIAGTFNDATNTLSLLRNDGNFVNVTGVTDTFTGNTSGSCITDLYVTNLHGCSPITIHDGIEHNGSTASGLLSVSLGDLTEASGDYSFAIGRQTVSSGLRSYSEGNRTTASNTNSHAEGNVTNATGENSHAEGNGTIASGDESHAEGNSTTASGNYSHSEGNVTTASGESSHAEGGGTIASGDYSHAEGLTTTASGESSHAEGSGTIASGATSHAEGINTTASGFASHTEGINSTASGNYSHAEGNGATASGFASHAQNGRTIASGTNSHAEGEKTIASGENSHAGGAYAVASGNTSFVHFSGTSTTYGAYSDYSAILGGVNNQIDELSNNSVILGGINNYIIDSIPNTIILGGNGITATTGNTVYVPNLVITNLTSVSDLQTNADGLLIDFASDITLKDNIEELSNALEKIISLNPVSFEWKEEMKLRKGKVFGLIAQEVEKIIPQIVRERANGDGTLTVEYKELIPWIISAIQELVENYKLAKVSPENSNIVPQYTPNSTDDLFGRVGTMTRDDNYLYIKGSDGWRRSKLEKF